MNRQEAIKKLNVELNENINSDVANGMHDFNVLTRKDDESTTTEYLWTLNNALKASQGSDVSTYKSNEINAALNHFRP